MQDAVKFMWPFLQGYLSKYLFDQLADFLQARRERRYQAEHGLAPPPPVMPDEHTVSWYDAFWYTMAGIMLGTALGVTLTYLLRERPWEA